MYLPDKDVEKILMIIRDIQAEDLKPTRRRNVIFNKAGKAALLINKSIKRNKNTLL